MIKRYFLLFVIFCSLSFGKGGERALSQTWNKVGTGLITASTVGGNVYELKKIGDTLFIGGAFAIYPDDTILDITGKRGRVFVKWNGNQWDTLPRFGPDSSGPYGLTEAIEYYNNELYLGGGYYDWGIFQSKIQYFTRWDGTYWQQVGGGNPNGYVVSMLYKGELYTGGGFSKIGSNITANRVARWNGTNWTGLGSGLTGDFSTARDMAVYNDELYVGGYFTNAGGKSAFSVAKWDGAKWSDLDTGVFGDVNAMAVDTINNFLYVGGEITHAGGDSGFYADGIVKWDGFKWIYGGYCQGITALAMYHNELFAGEYMPNWGDTVMRRYDGEQWLRVDNGPLATILSLAEYKDDLYVGTGYWITLTSGDSTWGLARYYAPPDTSCKYIQPLINSMLTDTNILKDVFYLDSTGKAEVKFYNNNKYALFWHWDFGDNNSDTIREPVHAYTDEGTYDVSVIVTHQHNYANKVCSNTANKTVVIMPYVGVEEQEAGGSRQLKIYPNPTGGSFTVEIQNSSFTIQNSSLKIYDAKGKLAKEIEVRSKKTEVSKEKLTKGVYIVHLIEWFDNAHHKEGKVVAEEKIVIE